MLKVHEHAYSHKQYLIEYSFLSLRISQTTAILILDDYLIKKN